MAIDIDQLSLLCQLPRGTLLSLGYPDLTASREDLEKLGARTFREITNPALNRWHAWDGPMYDTDPIIRDLGFDPVYLDMANKRGFERVVDLNYPLPADLHGRFDTVFDGGTLEHCFNIGQGFRNVALALKPDGFAIHINPVTHMNHGFYCVSPTLYHSFYREVIGHWVVWGTAQNRGMGKVDEPHGRGDLPKNASNVVVARHPVSDWPTQHKYLENPTGGLDVQG